jgi:uncharacterized protein
LAFLITVFMGHAAIARDFAQEDSNKAVVLASFDRWKNGTGGPFELLAPDAEWTICIDAFKLGAATRFCVGF